MTSRETTYFWVAAILSIAYIYQILYAFGGPVPEISSMETLAPFGRLAMIGFLAVRGRFISSNIGKIVMGIGGAIFMIAALFKIMHWQGANFVFWLGGPFCFIGYLIYWIKNKPKSPIDYFKPFLIAVLVYGVIARILHYPNIEYPEPILLCGIFIWEAIRMYNPAPEPDEEILDSELPK